MKERVLTILSILILCMVIATIILDLWLFESNQPTISDHATAWSHTASTLGLVIAGVILGSIPAFITGLLIGHWWWPNVGGEA